MNCRKCGSEKLYKKKGKKHIGLYCSVCEAWIKWLPGPWQEFIMPFGKWEGKTLFWIKLADNDYLEWLSNNSNSKSIRTQARRALLGE